MRTAIRGGAIPIINSDYSEAPVRYSSYDNIELDLFSSTDPAVLKRLEQYTSDLNNKIPTVLNKDRSELIQRLRAALSDREMRVRVKDNGRGSEDFFEELKEISDTKIEALAGEKAKAYVIQLQNDVTFLASSTKDLESFATQSKAIVLDKGDKLIVRNLALVAILASVLFSLIWLRERSDESWIDFLSSDEGLEATFTRLYDNKQIMSRFPPRFTLSEFIQAISLKEVPELLRPLLGRRLNTRYLGQISTLLLDKLEARKVIGKSDIPSIQPWFEIKVKQTEIESNRSK